MDKEEENKYVSQLLEVFNSCDTTGTGYLDKEELTELCQKLHLDAQLPLLLQTLLGNDIFARVNFEEFKEGFVAVLSTTIDISEDEMIPEEVKPKYVKGTKRYGRRTQPELEAVENEANKFLQEQNVNGQRKSQLKRSSSLESVESLKSDEEAENGKEPLNESFEAQGQLRTWNPEVFDRQRRSSSQCSDMTEHQVRDIWEELGIGHNGYLNLQELATVCKSIGLKDLSKEELEDLFNKLDRDGDGKVSFQEFQYGLFSHAPMPIASTPLKQRRLWGCYQPMEDNSRMTATPSLLSCFGGLHLFSSIDDGTGFGNPEQILFIWEEEGIEDGKDVLMSLDFSMGDRVNLLDLTTALDNEVMATKNRIHLAALASYKNELYHQHMRNEQVTRERDKMKQDLERSEKRNLQLADEVDDHNSEIEQLNESKIRDLELEYRQRISMLRAQMESEKEQFLQQSDQYRTKLESDLANLKMEETNLRDRLNLSVKENTRLQNEIVEVVEKLTEKENEVVKLKNNAYDMPDSERQTDYPPMELCNPEERFADIIKEYEIQCRELRDQNDELQLQFEAMRSQLSESKYSRLLAKIKDNKLLHLKAKEKIHSNHLKNGINGKKGVSNRLRRSASAAGANVAVESEPSPANIETELTKHQLKEQQQEIQDLKIQLETKVNYYEREVELMKVNFEKERKETEHSFKLEISEMEEQKVDLEELNAKYQEVIDGLKAQLSKSNFQEMEKRFEKAKNEMEQYYTKEISTLSQRLTAEREQLEQELRRTHHHELHSLRDAAEKEWAEKLAAIEAQYAEHCQNLVQKHYSEKKELLEKQELEKKSLVQENLVERGQWEEREKTLLAQCKKELLKQEEKHNEEQARICKSFAIEKENLESLLKTEIERLNEEISQLAKGNIRFTAVAPSGREAHQAWVNGQSYHCGKPYISDINKQQILHLEESLLEEALAIDDYVNRLEMDNKAFIVEQDQFNRDMNRTLHLKCCHLLYSLKAAEEKLSLLKETEESPGVKLQIIESLVSSLRAQLQNDTKEIETLMKNQKCIEEPSSQLAAKQEARPLFDFEEKQLLVHLQEKGDYGHEWTICPSSTAEQLNQKPNVSQVQDDEYPNMDATVLQELFLKNSLLSQKLRNKEEELCILQREMVEMVNRFQDMKKESAEQVADAKDEAEREKNSIRDRLFELEDLVRQLEIKTLGSQDHRMELGRLSEDNSLLRNKVNRLHQDMDDIENLNNKHRKQMADLKVEKDKLLQELEELNKQNQKYQDEICQLNTQSLQLNVTISDLAEQNTENLETIQQLTNNLRDVTEQKDGVVSAITKLQEIIDSLEIENHQQESRFQREKDQLERELQMFKDENQKHCDQLHQLNTQSIQLSSSVSDLSAQHVGNQETIHQLNSLLREVTRQKEEASAALEQLKETLNTLERAKLQQRETWKQEKDRLSQELHIANDKMQNQMQKHISEREDLLSGLNESNKQLAILDSLQKEVSTLRQENLCLKDQCHCLTRQIKEMEDKVTAMTELESEFKVTCEESQNLKQNDILLREELTECQDKLLEVNSKRALEQSQHLREVQQLKDKVNNAVSKEQLSQLQNRLLEEQQNVQQLQDRLRFNADQTNRLLAMQQEEHEKLLRRMEERLEEVEMDLKNVRVVLQEKVNQLKEQLEKNAKSGLLLKDLYVENAQLMKALQVTEQRQKNAEKKNYILEEKIAALNKVIGKIAPASLAV
ncbi:hypothetical protein GDO86_009298 [Hymenochirus boettgeri]|uniref:Ninein-like protein n=1 Tax=Hymenochirus boettgeri TaxID=247094 RepID=A0A8T2JKJ6_9PIPI|nr:hypothetical protein GDO86_009298 [Hymenochirus boettgeri]